MEASARILNEEIHRIKVIGRGSFGEVHEANCRGTSVAVKAPIGRATAQVLEDFQKEVEIMSQLRHPSICLYMGYCIPEPGKLVIVQELMSDSLDKVIHSRSKNTPLKQRLQLVLESCKGVAWLHALPKHLFHRDLKPENILIDQNGHAKVSDFGLSHFDDNWEEEHPIGTPLYMAPEVMRGQTITEKVDVYSLGIILWEVVTQQHPFSHHNSYPRYSNSVINGERPPIPASCPHSLADLMRQCWDAQPENRPTVVGVITKLEEILAELDNLNFAESVLAAIKQRDVAQFWIDNFMHQIEAPWSKFTQLLFEFFQAPVIEDPAEVQLAPDATDEQLKKASYSALLAFSKHSLGAKERFTLELKRRENLSAVTDVSNLTPEVQALYTLREAIRSNDKHSVGLTQFGAFCQRYGPLTPANFLESLHELRKLYSSEVFHGEQSGAEADNILKTKPNNSYLLRWGITRPDSFCLSYVTRNEVNPPVVTHVVLARKRDEAGNGYFDNKGARYPTLLEAAQSIAASLHLTPVKTDRFAWLFIEDLGDAGAYLPS
eukprot:TRINITY_DN802_c0_g2_i2.p1 TRINITY_DN802_c0_g2~~TRINITY_DN802_c0_g2_i2.p1  ORF type:complete len:613 (+),score=284.80 TRINITY_DN802_c0_g2_i2:197-1840(+)